MIPWDFRDFLSLQKTKTMQFQDGQATAATSVTVCNITSQKMNRLRSGFPIFRDFSLFTSFRRSCKTASEAAVIPSEETSAVAEFVEEDDEQEQRRQFIESQRNKSRLLKQHRNIVHEQQPYQRSESWVHNTLKYKRAMFGRYGLASGVDPRICFPTAEERAEKEEYDRVAYPYTLEQMRTRIEEEKCAKAERIRLREEQVAEKLSKLEKWTADFRNRVEKAEAEARRVKERRERLVEEVRRHFGFKLDVRDERFKELLAQKEKEDKKQQKEARKKAREEKIIAKLLAKGAEDKNPEKKPEETKEEAK
ncbi:large ribosomal subunit protein mL64 [Phlebotomus argentipes]|uniref:large ribosomal subunit protein mL64 n=1 Tax=Phlebotomus argentipes TaxID=94469 RepID=UPI0028933E65|nr:large ribosomal subunit protein mL64 [Phlebotomus argentipes]